MIQYHAVSTPTPERSKFIQDKLFLKGYGWGRTQKNYQYEEIKHLAVDKNKKIPNIYYSSTADDDNIKVLSERDFLLFIGYGDDIKWEEGLFEI